MKSRRPRRKALAIGSVATATVAFAAFAGQAAAAEFPSSTRTGDGSVHEIPPTYSGSSGPNALALQGSTGNVWFAERGATGQVPAVGRIVLPAYGNSFPPAGGLAYEIVDDDELPQVSRAQDVAGNDRYAWVLLDNVPSPHNTQNFNSAAGILRIDLQSPDRHVLCPLPGGYGSPKSIAYNPVNGFVYITGGGGIAEWRNASGDVNVIPSFCATGTFQGAEEDIPAGTPWREYDVEHSEGTGLNPNGLAVDKNTGIVYSTFADPQPVDYDDLSQGFNKVSGVMVVDPNPGVTNEDSKQYFQIPHGASAPNDLDPDDVVVNSDGTKGYLVLNNGDHNGSNPGMVDKVVEFSVQANVGATTTTVHSVAGPTTDRPNGIGIDPGGSVWYVDDTGNPANPLNNPTTKIGRMMPGEAGFTEFPNGTTVPDTVTPNYNGGNDLAFVPDGRAVVSAKVAVHTTGNGRGRLAEIRLDKTAPVPNAPVYNDAAKTLTTSWSDTGAKEYRVKAGTTPGGNNFGEITITNGATTHVFAAALASGQTAHVTVQALSSDGIETGSNNAQTTFTAPGGGGGTTGGGGGTGGTTGTTGGTTGTTGGTTGTTTGLAATSVNPRFSIVQRRVNTRSSNGASQNALVTRNVLLVRGTASASQAGRTVRIQLRRGSRTLNLGNVRIRPNGRLVGSFRLTSKGAVNARALLPATDTAEQATSRYVRVSAKTSLRSVRYRTVQRGGVTFVRVTGRTARTQAGRRVDVQQRIGRRNVRIGRARIAANGRFAALVKPRGNSATVRLRTRLQRSALANPANSPYRNVLV